MARRATRKNKTHRRRAHRGGGLGQSYSFGAPIVPGLGNAAEVVPMSSCMAAARPGMISTPTSGLGLPGLSGGGRRRRGTRRRAQRGGRYSFDLSTPVGAGAPWGTGIPQVMRIPCEGSIINPLNPAPHTPSTQPPIRGGGGLGVDNVRYTAPTAGYTNAASSWVGGTGAPVMVQTPYDARSMNMACTKTGGGRRRRGGRRNSRGRFTRRR